MVTDGHGSQSIAACNVCTSIDSVTSLLLGHHDYYCSYGGQVSKTIAADVIYRQTPSTAYCEVWPTIDIDRWSPSFAAETTIYCQSCCRCVHCPGYVTCLFSWRAMVFATVRHGIDTAPIAERCHGMGGGLLFADLLTWGVQYITRIMTPKKVVSATRPLFVGGVTAVVLKPVHAQRL